MINYIEKGESLHAAIKDAGHRLYQEDRDFKSSNDEAVQAIIDSHDPLPYERAQAKKRLIIETDKAAESIESKYSEVEKKTFTKQENEARAFVLDNSAETPTLTAISNARGVPVSVLASKIIANADAYTLQIGTLVGQRQAQEDLIDSETDFRVIQGIAVPAIEQVK